MKIGKSFHFLVETLEVPISNMTKPINDSRPQLKEKMQTSSFSESLFSSKDEKKDVQFLFFLNHLLEKAKILKIFLVVYLFQSEWMKKD